MIRRILRKERTDYGKRMRKQYESGEFWDSRHNMTVHSIRPDELSNTLSTVLKDNLLIEIHGVEEPKGSDTLERFLIDDQGRTTKMLKPLCISPTLRREMHGNEPRVVEPVGWRDAEQLSKGSDYLTNINEVFEGKPFNYVSLFSGIGGFEQALNKLGGTCVMASEIDKFANQAYEVLYGHKTVGDVTKIEAADVPDHDLLVGGFPCQSFSVAGKRLGFEDTRGTLFFEMARIAKTKKPKVILAENVKGLVGHDKGRTLNVIIQTLCDIGYTVDFNVLNSKYFGVPQNRERIFIVAIRDDLVEQEPWHIEGTNVVAKGKRRITQLDGIKTFNFDWPSQNEVTTRLRDILESEVDEKYYLSEEKTAKLVAQLDKELPAHFPTADDINNTLRTGGKGSLTAKHNYEHIAEPQMLGHIDLKGHDEIKRVYSTEGIPPTLTTMGGGNREPKIAEEQEYSWEDEFRIRREEQEVRPVLTPDRLEKRQNGRRFKDDGEESFTLTAQDRHGVATGIPPRYRIRKLTPLECFRLQGFPDEAHQALVDAGISNSQLYKMAGNAVTVNVIDAIGRRLLSFLN